MTDLNNLTITGAVNVPVSIQVKKVRRKKITLMVTNQNSSVFETLKEGDTFVVTNIVNLEQCQ